MNELRRPWRIVVIADDARLRAEVVAALRRGPDRSYEPAEAGSAEEGLRLCRADPPPDCVVLDFDLSGRPALTVLRDLPRDLASEGGLPAVPVIVLTGAVAGEASREVLRAGAQDFVGKDWLTPDSLARAIENAAERLAMARELRDREATLRASENRLNLALDSGRMGLWEWDVLTERSVWNAKEYELLGLPAGTGVVSTDLFFRHVHPEDAPALDRSLAAVKAAGSGWEHEFRIVRADGEVRWLAGVARLFRGPDGRPGKMIGVNYDVTERKQAVAAARASGERLRLALDAANMGTFVWYPEEDRTEQDDRMLALFGIPSGGSISLASAVAGRIHPEDAGGYAEAVARALDPAGRGRLQEEIRAVHPDGAVRWLAVTGQVAFSGEPRRALSMSGVVLDIDGRKRIEAEREHLLAAEPAARSEVERVARIKDEFLATLSHELRTPLAAIVGWAQVLQRAGGNAADGPSLHALVREGIEVIARNADAQSRLINDLLDMSRIVSGKLKMEMAPVDPNLVAAAAADTVRPVAESKGVRLELRPGQRLPQVHGDAGRLRQVLWNLLTNAVKFTPAGGRVTLATAAVDGAVLLVVEDTGQGLDPGFMPRLFERFSQADSSAARKHGGLGLGLSIVKQLVELHGGAVAAESDGPDRGARFTVTLPVLPPAASAPAPAAAEDLRGAGGGGAGGAAPGRPEEEPEAGEWVAREWAASLDGVSVLVVDDQPDTLEAARRLLAESGAVVATATSAADALDQLRRQRPHVLLSDIGMPEVDGYQLIRAVREELSLGPGDLPAAALTAFARAEDRDRTLAAGYQAHLVKPLRPHVLIPAVAALARSRIAPEEPAGQGPGGLRRPGP
ncbi:MAG TPA: response regulator [Thermoanaerobaculia bacterium]|nr:response regulator [Thermoanaerobaculia bacterium]